MFKHFIYKKTSVKKNLIARFSLSYRLNWILRRIATQDDA